MLNEKRKAENSDKPEPNEAVKLSCVLYRFITLANELQLFLILLTHLTQHPMLK